jgi:uncharacterized protein
LRDKLSRSPILVRIAPFLIFAGLTTLQGRFGDGSRYWIYLIKTLLGAVLIWWMRPFVPEMRWRLSWQAVAVGILVFGIWVGLDSFYPKWGTSEAQWNPHEYFGRNSVLAWFMIIVRLGGVALVVPGLEEVFYRSFMYRYVVRPAFESVSLRCLNWTALTVTAAIFGFAHFEWLAAILCALLYQALVISKGRLGDAMLAHAVTNLLLGLWVVGREAWHFW